MVHVLFKMPYGDEFFTKDQDLVDSIWSCECIAEPFYLTRKIIYCRLRNSTNSG